MKYKGYIKLPYEVEANNELEAKEKIADYFSDACFCTFSHEDVELETDNKEEWILDYRDCGVEFYRCSKCNLGRAVIDGSYYKSLDEFKKCPNCGADMKGDKAK